MEGFTGIALGLALISSYASVGSDAPKLAAQGATPEYGSRYYVVHASSGESIVPFLGDEDRRRNFLAGIAYFKPEPKLRFRRHRADLLQELYYEHSHSPGASGQGPNTYEAVGYLFGGRYNFERGRYGWYLDLGLGLQYNNHRSVDLPARLNSTPFIDLGFYIPAGKNAITVGARVLHISNAHTEGNNQGQNQLLFDLGYKF